MDAASRMEVNSTVSGLSDDQLLEQTGKLARLDHQIQVFVIDHLCEIDARQLYLRRGYSSPFDYVTRGLGYSAAAAWRRINAMKLCVRIEGVRERLRDGSLTLDAAAQLQGAFERRDRERAPEARSATAGAGSAARPYRSAPAGPARRSAVEADVGRIGAEGAGGGGGRQEHAAGDADAGRSRSGAGRCRPIKDAPAAARVVGSSRWRSTRSASAGWSSSRGLLTHVDPHMTLGQLVGRLVKEGLERHDPSRPRRSRPTANRTADAERTSAPKQSASPTEITSSPTEARQGQDQERPSSTSGSERPAQPACTTTSAPKSRAPGHAIPAAVKREIWQRYEGRCGYIDPRTGRRCASRHLLQVDHVFPYAMGGGAEPDNLRLLCAAHHRHRHRHRHRHAERASARRACRVNVVDPLRKLVDRRTPPRDPVSPSSKGRR